MATELSDIVLHFGDSCVIDLDEFEWLIGSRDGQSNRADAGVEVDDGLVGGDKGANVSEGVAVDGQIYLEKALGGIAKCRVEQGIAQRDVAKALESLGDTTGWRARVAVDDFPALR